ncbi:hypothetical protein [Vibrio hepatarius]|uniref:hypothetical protein n=1 Tax=Vibrio hepatarius TaxID=171383 RepID=UPI001C090E96|nr:hypothetical protein [Vibrio hepatarius]MBU2895246.1 hypothetical protein [Vibrio hepatarius]
MIDFEKRLAKLKDRRQGALERATPDSMMILEKAGSFSSHLDNREREAYEKLGQSASIKYAIGAMSAVDDASTQVSIREGERVAETLSGLLKTAGINTTYRMQGSVPLNIHIKGHSDVDMLILEESTILVQNPVVDTFRYSEPTDKRPMVEIIKRLREVSEEKLTTRYHEVEVDCDNAKSIAMSGGSLQRKIDIVPSCWLDTAEYQNTNDESERGVKIYDKKSHILLGNAPFKHIKLVDEKDKIYRGNLKKCVRLLKTLVADMPDYKKVKAKELSSFDLVAIVYHMNDLLNVNAYTPLALVAAIETQLGNLRYIEVLRDISVPDGSRKVFNSDKKLEALAIFHDEISALSRAIYKDLVPGVLHTYDSKVLNEKVIAL